MLFSAKEYKILVAGLDNAGEDNDALQTAPRGGREH